MQRSLVSSHDSEQSLSGSPRWTRQGSPVEEPHTPPVQLSAPLQNAPSLHAEPLRRSRHWPSTGPSATWLQARQSVGGRWWQHLELNHQIAVASGLRASRCRVQHEALLEPERTVDIPLVEVRAVPDGRPISLQVGRVWRAGEGGSMRASLQGGEAEHDRPAAPVPAAAGPTRGAATTAPRPACHRCRAPDS